MNKNTAGKEMAAKEAPEYVYSTASDIATWFAANGIYFASEPTYGRTYKNGRPYEETGADYSEFISKCFDAGIENIELINRAIIESCNRNNSGPIWLEMLKRFASELTHEEIYKLAENAYYEGESVGALASIHSQLTPTKIDSRNNWQKA